MNDIDNRISKFAPRHDERDREGEGGKGERDRESVSMISLHLPYRNCERELGALEDYLVDRRVRYAASVGDVFALVV